MYMYSKFVGVFRLDCFIKQENIGHVEIKIAKFNACMISVNNEIQAIVLLQCYPNMSQLHLLEFFCLILSISYFPLHITLSVRTVLCH